MISTLLSQKEASDFIDSLENKTSKRLMISAIHSVIVYYMKNSISARSDVDLEFLAKALLPFCENQEAIQEILNGEPLLFEENTN